MRIRMENIYSTTMNTSRCAQPVLQAFHGYPYIKTDLFFTKENTGLFSVKQQIDLQAETSRRREKASCIPASIESLILYVKEYIPIVHFSTIMHAATTFFFTRGFSIPLVLLYPIIIHAFPVLYLPSRFPGCCHRESNQTKSAHSVVLFHPYKLPLLLLLLYAYTPAPVVGE